VSREAQLVISSHSAVLGNHGIVDCKCQLGSDLGSIVIRSRFSRPRKNNRGAGALADLFILCLLFTIQHHLVESMGQGLAA
jgi:hypothetical protein